MIGIDLEIGKILENTKEKLNDGIQNFCNELSEYLRDKEKLTENTLDLLKTFNNEINDKYFYIVSGEEFLVFKHMKMENVYLLEQCISQNFQKIRKLEQH